DRRSHSAAVQRSAARPAADRGRQGARDRRDDGQAHRFAAERSADRRYGEGLRYGALADADGARGHAAADHRPAAQRDRALYRKSRGPGEAGQRDGPHPGRTDFAGRTRKVRRKGGRGLGQARPARWRRGDRVAAQANHRPRRPTREPRYTADQQCAPSSYSRAPTRGLNRRASATSRLGGMEQVLAQSGHGLSDARLTPPFHKWKPSAPSGAGPDARPRGTLKQCFERGRYSECLSIAVDKPGDLQPKRQTVILQYGQRDRGDAE